MNYDKCNAVTKHSECRSAEDEALLVVCASELAQLYTAIAADKVHSLCHFGSVMQCQVVLLYALYECALHECAALSDAAAEHGCVNHLELADRVR